MTKKIALLLICCGTVLTGIYSQTGALNVQKGQQFKVSISITSNSNVEAMGQVINTDLKSTTLSIYEIDKVMPDEITIKTTIKKMVASLEAMGQSSNFDSDKKDNGGPLAEQLAEKVNKTRTLQVNGKGIITGGDETAEAIPGTSGSAGKCELFEPALLGRTLKVGDSFTDTFSVKQDKLSSRDSGTYTVTAIENGIATINYTGIQKLNSVMEQMGMEVSSASVANVKTEFQMDIQSGVLRSVITELDTTATIEVAGTTLPSTGKTTTTIRIEPAS